MPFGMVSEVGRGIGVLDGGGDRRWEGAVWGEFGASHSNHWDSPREGRRRALPTFPLAYFPEMLLFFGPTVVTAQLNGRLRDSLVSMKLFICLF